MTTLETDQSEFLYSDKFSVITFAHIRILLYYFTLKYFMYKII